jgi:hypothetical protein
MNFPIGNYGFKIASHGTTSNNLVEVGPVLSDYYFLPIQILMEKFPHVDFLLVNLIRTVRSLGELAIKCRILYSKFTDPFSSADGTVQDAKDATLSGNAFTAFSRLR